MFFETLDKSIGGNSLRDAIFTLESIALFKGNVHAVHLRIAAVDVGIVIDLGREDGLAVSITASGWSVGPTDVRFLRSPGMQALPIPEQGGTLEPLRETFNLSPEAFASVCAILMNGLRGEGPYFGALIEGPQGAGKSFLCWVIKMLIDPHAASRQRLPENERDLMIQAKDHHLLNYDNASGMKAAISDSLCTLATGGGLVLRKLYTDDEAQVFSFKRPVVINGISGAAKRPDLLERIIPITLEGLGDNSRRTEAELEAEFMAARPMLFGALCSAAASALARLPHTDTPTGIRMADAAKWLAAAEEALGFASGVLVDTVRKGQDALFIDRITEDPLMIALQVVVRSKAFEGHVAVLFDELCKDGRRDPNLPKTPSHLSSALTRLKPSMRKAGLHVEDLGRDKRGRRVRIRADETFASLWGG